MIQLPKPSTILLITLTPDDEVGEFKSILGKARVGAQSTLLPLWTDFHRHPNRNNPQAFLVSNTGAKALDPCLISPGIHQKGHRPQ